MNTPTITGDAGASMVVTAHMDTPSIGLDTHPLMLDGPLAWAHVMDAKSRGEALPPMSPGFVADFPLPLARWEEGDAWGWCTSAAALTVEAHVSTQVRRKPNTTAMARYARDAKHHLGLGPHKARDTALAASWVTSATWRIRCTDPDRLHALLRHVTHLGERHRNGFGHVARWVVEPHHDPDGWRERPFPHTHPQVAVRAPYWHHTRRAA